MHPSELSCHLFTTPLLQHHHARDHDGAGAACHPGNAGTWLERTRTGQHHGALHEHYRQSSNVLFPNSIERCLSSPTHTLPTRPLSNPMQAHGLSHTYDVADRGHLNLSLSLSGLVRPAPG